MEVLINSHFERILTFFSYALDLTIQMNQKYI